MEPAKAADLPPANHLLFPEGRRRQPRPDRGAAKLAEKAHAKNEKRECMCTLRIVAWWSRNATQSKASPSGVCKGGRRGGRGRGRGSGTRVNKRCSTCSVVVSSDLLQFRGPLIGVLSLRRCVHYVDKQDPSKIDETSFSICSARACC